MEARALGEMLARRGHAVLTGGYTGTMEAVSRGAAAAGGHVIGVTCDDIGRYHGRSANPWVMEERRCPTLLERLRQLIEGSDAAIALPGGPGTLTEIALTWNLMIVGSLARRPLILVGEAWKQLWSEFYTRFSDYSPSAQRELIAFAGTVREAADMLDATTGQVT